LIDAGVKRVIAAMRDPHDVVSGRGIRRLRRAGIEVCVGLLGDEARELNRAYLHFVSQGRPYVMVKVAQSLDGKVATRTGESKWITGEAARKKGHQLRQAADAIVVGVNTVIADDPLLNCRLRGGVDPLRIILDTNARTPPDARILGAKQHRPAPTWVVVGKNSGELSKAKTRRQELQARGATLVPMSLSRGRISVKALMKKCAQKQIVSVLVEGGPSVVASFFEAGCVNEVFAFIAPMVIGGADARSSVEGVGPGRLGQAFGMEALTVERVGDDLLVTGRRRQ